MGKLSRQVGGYTEGRIKPLERVDMPESRPKQGMPLLKKLFWLYFLLLIFEGALRKWFFPQYSAPLLLVRDPVAMFIIWEAYRTNKWPKRWSAIIGVLTAVFLSMSVIQVVAGGNPWLVAVYGLRSYLLPFPVAFIMGENLDREELRQFAVFTLWILLPMTGLEVAQYLAPAGSLLNKGAYAGASQIVYVGSHVRASGTFSYVVGPISLGPLAAAFIFYGMATGKFVQRWLLWAATFALLLSIPVVGARTMVYELGGVLACVAFGGFFGVSQFTRSLKIIMPILIVGLLVSRLAIFSEASHSLDRRFNQASENEGNAEQSLLRRTLLPITHRIENTDYTSNLIGVGMGRGSAAMSKLLIGTVVFLTGEDEFSREMDELGPFMGFAFMLFRLILALMIIFKALQRARDHDPLPLLLVPLMFSTLFLGILEQPTDQGFMVIAVAFSLAALHGTPLSIVPAPIVNPRMPRVRYNPRLQSRGN